MIALSVLMSWFAIGMVLLLVGALYFIIGVIIDELRDYSRAWRDQGGAQ